MMRRIRARGVDSRGAMGVMRMAGVALGVAVSPLAAQSPVPLVSPNDTLTSSFTVDGLRVILRRNGANNVVAANLYLLGGVRQVTPATAGIEPFLLAVSERGTRHYPKAALRRAMSMLGSEIVVEPEVDWTLFGVRTITQSFDSTWAIFSDRMMFPVLQPSEVELVRTQLLSAIRQDRDDPDALVSALADSVSLVGHPYGISPAGTEASIRRITPTALREYQRTQFVKSRMLLVVVGDVSRSHLEGLIRGTLARLPLGTYRWTLPPPTPSATGPAVLAQRSLPTNYILGYFSGPLAPSRDAQVLRVAMTVLTGEMFSEIRSRENLTYDVHASFLDRAATAGGVYVTTVAPDTTLQLMRIFVRALQERLLSREGLNRLVLSFITDYFLANETNASQANFLARAQLYQGDYRRGATFVDDIRAVTPEDVQRVAREYVRHLRFAYVGDTTRVDRRLLDDFAPVDTPAPALPLLPAR